MLGAGNLWDSIGTALRLLAIGVALDPLTWLKRNTSFFLLQLAHCCVSASLPASHTSHGIYYRQPLYDRFCKLGGPFVGVLITRPLLHWGLY